MVIPSLCAILAVFSLIVFITIAITDKKFDGKFFGYTVLCTALLAFWLIAV